MSEGDTGRRYIVYMLRCSDGSLYTGITTDIRRRLDQHNGLIKGGARCTAARRPLSLVCGWSAPDRAAASRLEYRLKRLTKAQKEELVSGGQLPPDISEGVERLAL